MCARTGWRVDTSALAIIIHSRERRWIALNLRRNRTAGCAIVLKPVIKALRTRRLRQGNAQRRKSIIEWSFCGA
jgi:hypothetical protein